MHAHLFHPSLWSLYFILFQFIWINIAQHQRVFTWTRSEWLPLFAFVLFVLASTRPDSFSVSFVLSCFSSHTAVNGTIHIICLICKLIPIYTIVFARISILGSSFTATYVHCAVLTVSAIQTRFYVVTVAAPTCHVSRIQVGYKRCMRIAHTQTVLVVLFYFCKWCLGYSLFLIWIFQSID